MAQALARESAGSAAEEVIAQLMKRAHAAFAGYADADQETVDQAVRGLAWALYRPEHARELAELAVADTGLGNVADKIAKNQRKTFGTLRDLLRVRTVGVIEEDPARGIVKYAKPVGVVGAITPSTNPAATPVNKAMMALKGRNAVVIAPSPTGWRTTARAVDLMRAALAGMGLPADLIQVVPQPVDRARTQALMRAVDLVVCTGSQTNVREAYRSGTPAIGVGAGNVPVIVDESADLHGAAAKIARSKCFDNATSCSSENALVVLDEVYADVLAALAKQGGHLCSAAERARLEAVLFEGGRLSRALIAKDAAVIAERVGLGEEAARARFFLVEESGIGAGNPFSGEKLSLVLAVYRARDFEHAKALCRALLAFQGRGHSVGIHSRRPERARALAADLDVVRVLVNQAHTFGNGGGFDNGLPFTLSMGCGTWAGNSISENLCWRHFINVTHLVTTIAEDKPSEEALFGPYWRRYGR
jgi:sulfoacetaldehyde dehydrogenase